MKRFFDNIVPTKVIRGRHVHFFSTFFDGTELQRFYEVSQTEAVRNSLHKLDELKERVKGRQAQADGNLQTVIQDKLRYLWTYHSNAIEGSKLTLADTIFFLQEGLTVDGMPFKDFVDARNHVEAIDYLHEVVRKTYPLDPYLLSSLNALLMKGVDYIPGKDAAGNPIQKRVYPGEYKKDPNYVIQPDGSIHEYVEPHLVAPQIDGLCQWLSTNPENYHPIILAAIGHYNMVRIHPFQDGNGRGARLLMNLILMREQYMPAIIRVENRKQYLVALKEGDKGNLIPFVQFVTESVVNTYSEVFDEITKYLSEKSSPPSMKC